jgi:hypothetical protein
MARQPAPGRPAPKGRRNTTIAFRLPFSEREALQRVADQSQRTLGVIVKDVMRGVARALLPSD